MTTREQQEAIDERARHMLDDLDTSAFDVSEDPEDAALAAIGDIEAPAYAGPPPMGHDGEQAEATGAPAPSAPSARRGSPLDRFSFPEFGTSPRESAGALASPRRTPPETRTSSPLDRFSFPEFDAGPRESARALAPPSAPDPEDAALSAMASSPRSSAASALGSPTPPPAPTTAPRPPSTVGPDDSMSAEDDSPDSLHAMRGRAPSADDLGSPFADDPEDEALASMSGKTRVKGDAAGDPGRQSPPHQRQK